MARKNTDPIRMTANIEGDFAVFITGMRVNQFWKIHKWLPNMSAMRKIIPVLAENREYGALGGQVWYSLRGLLLIVYFRSVEQMEFFANDPNAPHAEAWRAFFRRISKNKREVGVWHETYVVRDGEYEAVYAFMPKPTGLGSVRDAWVPVQHKGDKAALRRAAGARAAAERATAEANGHGDLTVAATADS